MSVKAVKMVLSALFVMALVSTSFIALEQNQRLSSGSLYSPLSVSVPPGVLNYTDVKLTNNQTSDLVDQFADK